MRSPTGTGESLGERAPSYLQTGGKKKKRVTTCLPLMHSLFAVHKEGGPRPVFRQRSNKMDKVIFAGLCVYHGSFPFFFSFFFSRVRRRSLREIASVDLLGRWSNWGRGRISFQEVGPNLTLNVTRLFGLYSEIVIVVSVMNAWNIQLNARALGYGY